jgi:hypothetical protein
MLPKWHLLLGFIFSLFLLIINIPLSYLGIFFFSSFLIDIDHWFGYIFQKKKFSPIKAIRWNYLESKRWDRLSKNEQEKYKSLIMIFHNLEFLFILFLLSIFYNPFLFVLFGCLFHLITDWIYSLCRNKIIYPKISIIYTLVKNKNKKDFN